MSYNKLSSEDIVLSSEVVSTPIWTGDKEVISGSELTTSSAQIGGLSSKYYIDVYNVQSENVSESRVQFSIAYADKNGSGSKDEASKAIYGQYRTLVLGDEDSDFQFNPNEISSNFWAISIDRARYKEKLVPGTLELALGSTGSSEPSLTLIDDSGTGEPERYLDGGRYYKLLNKDDLGEAYGYLLPDIGTILLDCDKIAGEIRDLRPVESVSGNSEYVNTEKLLKGIKTFKLKSQETVTSNYVFIRVRNSECNYSMNPTCITYSGELKHTILINSPETFITTVGLYNNNNDLLAVAKLSKPLSKTFNKEALIRVKLDY